jgi:ABC-2 type transport system permease protein
MTAPVVVALRAGWSRGLIELRQSFTNAAELLSHTLWPLLVLAATWFLRDVPVAPDAPPLGTLILPSALGMNAALGMVSLSQLLVTDREDGTLLRAKAVPNGMLGYLIGKVVSVAGGLLADLAILLVPGLVLIAGLTLSAGAWATLAWVLPLGIVATLPLGAVLGSLFTSARAQGLLTLPVLGAIAISGIFYPLSALPGWLQVVGQLLPFYWLGLGTRSALLPDSAAALEIGGSWRHLETAGMLGAWAVVGLVVAPVVLRRMVRGESGSEVAERRNRALRRVG